MNTAQELLPPIAKKIPEEIIYHNEKYLDDYAWLKNKENPEVISYLEQENAYKEQKMLHTKAFQEELYKEMVARIQETDMNVPEKVDNYYYYSRTQEGKQYKIYCRKKDSLEAPEELILDLNELAEGKDYLSLGIYEISPNHRYLAYSIDNDGSESYTIFFKDLETGTFFPETIKDSCTTAEWLNDNKTLLYTTLDSTKRPYKVFSHVLNSDSATDNLIYHEEDEAFYVNISKTNSKKYIFITMVSKTTSESYFTSADDDSLKLNLIKAREKDIEYYPDHKDDLFYITTNVDGAFNFKVVTTPIATPAKENWKDFVPHDENSRIDYIDMLKDYVLVYQRKDGLKNIRVIGNNQDYFIDFPEPVYNVSSRGNSNFEEKTIRFVYASLKTPESVFDFNLEDKTRELKKQYKVLGDYNPDNYECERLFAPANDGTLIPISIMYKKGMEKNGENKLYLYGYGSYEISIEPNFSSNRLSLIDRGFIFAIAHIRGGGEMGRLWYENGKFLNKKNTFNDFINSAEFLIKEKYTAPEKMVIMGGSAGGLLMGAVTNLRPDLFKGVIAHVPFVDVINTMMDPTLPLTVIEYDEWGDPNDKKYFDYMKSYSPYDNIEAKEYPNMFITGGLNDPRVGYWEPAKWTARLRSMKTDNNLLLMKINMGAGHGGSSGRYDYLKEIAEEYAFILDLF